MKLSLQKIYKCAVICTIGLQCCVLMPNAYARAENDSGFLTGSVYERVGLEKNLDPYLLYSISLLESASRADLDIKSGVFVAPYPYAIRGPDGAVYPKTYQDAVKELERQIRKYGKRKLDIGLMQVNGQHWKNVKRPADLLDPYVNVSLGADILQSVIKGKSGSDLELAIGHYHSPTEWRARNYGERVLAVYKNLAEMEIR